LRKRSAKANDSSLARESKPCGWNAHRPQDKVAWQRTGVLRIARLATIRPPPSRSCAMGTGVIPMRKLAGSICLPFLAWTLAGAAIAPASSTPSLAPATRCGWFVNPTPGNASLIDRDGEWIVGVQGGHQADGDWPEFADDQWISTNRNYGYGCACMRVVADPKSHEIQKILKASVRPIKACRLDRTLGKPVE
jgi:hypothetical protein